jgi:acetyl esterase/lipase
VTYKAGLQLDVYRPGTLTGRPALVLVHGGGWMGGDKAGTNQVETARAFARRGFVVFSVNHSLNPVGNRTPNFRQPPIDDVADAVEWVRANAATYGADGTKVAALGQSSGGHLALMVALTKAGNEKPDAVLCWSAPTRLEDFDFTPAAGSREQLVVDYIGVDDLTNAAFDTFSPYYQSLASSPPIRLVHSQDEGDNAYGVPVSNADDMHAALVAAGRDSTKVIEPGNVHADFIDDTDAGTDWLESKLDVATNVRTIAVPVPVAVAGDDGFVEQAGTAYGGTDGGTGIDLMSAQLLVRNSRTTFGAPFTFIRSNTVLRFADTVALPDDAAIASASLFIRTSATAIANADARNLQIEWIADRGTIDIGDFSAVTAATAKAETPLSGLAPSVRYEWSLLNPAANVSKTTPTGLRLHVDGGEPTGQNHVHFVAFDDATLDGPELLVVYSEPTGAGAEH